MVIAPAKRERVRFAQSRDLSERRALRLAGMSASVLRRQRREDGKRPLRKRMVATAHRDWHHGYRMIYLRLPQADWLVNLRRVRRLYREERLMVQRGKRKKVAPWDPPTKDSTPIV